MSAHTFRLATTAEKSTDIADDAVQIVALGPPGQGGEDRAVIGDQLGRVAVV